jgi:hypothetical protein
VGCRQGWRQQLQDQAVFTPVDCDPSQPANSVQSAPMREKKPSFSPFTPKVGMFRRPAGGKSPRLETATAGSRVASQKQALWKQAGQRLDVATSHNKKLGCFGYFCDLSRSLLGRGKGARDHSYERIKGRIGRSVLHHLLGYAICVLHERGRQIDQQLHGNLSFFFTAIRGPRES